MRLIYRAQAQVGCVDGGRVGGNEHFFWSDPDSRVRSKKICTSDNNTYSSCQDTWEHNSVQYSLPTGAPLIVTLIITSTAAL